MAFEEAAADDEQVKQAVAVVIDHGHAAAQRLQDGKMALFLAVVVGEVEARLVGNVLVDVVRRRLIGRGRGGFCGSRKDAACLSCRPAEHGGRGDKAGANEERRQELDLSCSHEVQSSLYEMSNGSRYERCRRLARGEGEPGLQSALLQGGGHGSGESIRRDQRSECSGGKGNPAARQPLAQQLAALGQPAAHGAERATEEARRFLLGLAFQVAEDESGAVLF